MPCAGVCSYGSYFDDWTLGFFENPRNKISHKCTDLGFIDKVAKLADPILDAASVISESQGASEETLQSLGKARTFVKTGRDFLGIYNIFNGVIAALVINVKHICALLGNLATGSDERVSFKEVPAQYNDVAVTVWEKVAALFENIGKGTGAATYILGFGVFRLVSTIKKHIYSKIDSGNHCSEAFIYSMTVNHAAGVVGNAAGLTFQLLAYNRDEAVHEKHLFARGATHVGKDNPLIAKTEAVFFKKMRDNAVGLALKITELVADILHLAGTVTPAWARIILSSLIAILGVAKEWIKE